MHASPALDMESEQLDNDTGGRVGLAAATFRGVLSPAQVRLLVAVLVDRESHHQIARRLRKPRETIRDRGRSAARKLELRLGVKVKLPGRGRSRTARMSLCDGETIDRLLCKANAEGQLVGTWIDSKERGDR